MTLAYHADSTNVVHIHITIVTSNPSHDTTFEKLWNFQCPDSTVEEPLGVGLSAHCCDVADTLVTLLGSLRRSVAEYRGVKIQERSS